MSIEFINNTQKAFTIVNKALTMDKSLSLKDRGMMVTLLSLPPVWEFTAEGIAAILPDGKDAVNSSLNRLEEKNYILREQTKSADGTFSKTRLVVNPNPKAPCTENPCTENPDTDNPSADKPSTENPPQINNKEISTKEINNKESITHSIVDAAAVRNEVREQIEYEAVKIDRKNDIKLLDLIVDLIVQTLTEDKDSIKIGSMVLPAEEVKDKFRKLNMYNIEFVIDRVRETKTKITNQNAYLISCLYRAEEQEDLYWDNLVKCTEGH